MPNPYSAEMRERVIARVESGASRREAAEHFEISASAAVKWLQRWRIYLWLLARGYPALLVDGSGPIIGLKGKYFPGKAAKYYKGQFPLYAVDHTYSEMIYIGF